MNDSDMPTHDHYDSLGRFGVDHCPACTITQTAPQPPAIATRAKACVTCDGPTSTVGWSQCDSCFRSDQYHGFDYWVRPLVVLLFLVALMILAAALARLT